MARTENEIDMTPADVASKIVAPARAEKPAVPFGSNVVRLSFRGWLLALAIVATIFFFVPSLWQSIEPFQPGPDFRIPYRLGEDYWMYRRWCREVCPEDKTLLVGDSVIWGHYVSTDQTLSHHLNQQTGAEHFANLGVDGIHPAALAGLMEHYASDIRGKRVILFCNPLWMSSARHDLQEDKEFRFNHPRLVPQFDSRLRCYNESIEGRLGIVAQRSFPFLGWVNHLRIAYFDNEDFFAWTLEHPYENPADPVTLKLPSPDEPPSPPPVAKSWTAQHIETYNPAWVDLNKSFQWESFRRTIALLQSRGNRVFVLVGPFNEHMLKPQGLAAYQRMKAEIGAWLREQDVPHFIPAPLPSEMYADASHPLGNGYALLARQLLENEKFTTFQGEH